VVLAAFLGLAACGSGGSETAIIVEVVPGTVDPTTLDEVLFRVMGRGIEAGERIARAALRGSDAKGFPLSLAIHGTALTAGPFTVEVEGRAGGVLRATASSGGPLAFEDGTVVRHRLVLRAIDDEIPPVKDAGAHPVIDTADASAAVPAARDPGRASADAATPRPTQPVAADAGPGGSGGVAGTGGASGSGGAADAGTGGATGSGGEATGGTSGAGGPGCDGCNKMCMITGGSACRPAPDGTRCRGNSGMTCQRCQCGK
jgi:hypothetical protein